MASVSSFSSLDSAIVIYCSVFCCVCVFDKSPSGYLLYLRQFCQRMSPFLLCLYSPEIGLLKPPETWGHCCRIGTGGNHGHLLCHSPPSPFTLPFFFFFPFWLCCLAFLLPWSPQQGLNLAPKVKVQNPNQGTAKEFPPPLFFK